MQSTVNHQKRGKNYEKRKENIFSRCYHTSRHSQLFTLAGCGDDYNDYDFATAPMSVSIYFGESFMETAGVTQHEWLEYLQEQNKDGRAGIFTEGDAVVLQVLINIFSCFGIISSRLTESV